MGVMESGIANPNRPCCSSCGDEHLIESMTLYRFELICATCKEDHEAATTKADADEFRRLSLEWFKSSHLERQPYMLRNNFGVI